MPCGTLWFQRLLVHTPATPRAINGRPLPVGVRSLFSGPPTVLATDLLKLDSRSPRRAGFHGPGMKGRCFVAARPHCERPTKEMLCEPLLFQRSGTDRHTDISIGTKKEQMIPFKTDSTTVSSLVYFNMTGNVVSSLVAPAGAIQV